MEYLKLIKDFNKISISSICSDLKINRSNLLNGNSSKENEKKVYEELKKRLEKIIK